MKRLMVLLLLLACPAPAGAACLKYNWRALASAAGAPRIPNYYTCDTLAELNAVPDALEGDIGLDRDKNLLYLYAAGAWLSMPTTPTGTGYRKVIAGGEQGSADLVTLTDADEVAANQGTTTTVLHGNAAGQASFGAVSSADIPDATLTYADIQNIAALSVMGRAANTSGVGADITGAAGQVLRVSSAPTLGFGSVDLAAAAAVGTSILPTANGGTGIDTSATADDRVLVSSGAGWVAKSVPNCTDSVGQHLNYTTATNAFSCGTRSDGAKIMLAADYTNATTTFSNTALSRVVTAGQSYTFLVHVFVSDSVAADGAKFDFEGSTATATNFRARCTLTDTALLLSTEVTALATDMAQATITGAGHLECAGTIEPSGSGTLVLRAAQNAHTTGTLTIARGSFLWVEDVTP